MFVYAVRNFKITYNNRKFYEFGKWNRYFSKKSF